VCTGPSTRPEDPSVLRRTRVNRESKRGSSCPCANPDIVDSPGDALAAMVRGCGGRFPYTEMGGESLYFGKPHLTGLMILAAASFMLGQDILTVASGNR